jgi:NAD(P)H-nitrite reductase large subunit
LNTRAIGIDFKQRKIRLGIGEELDYDRLILAMGSRSLVPPSLQGFGLPGTFVLREADDAMEIRSYVQQHTCTQAVIAGGGLLGLEAAYALQQLGLHVTVLERSEYILRRQLDRRSSELLQMYMKRMGIDILRQAELVGVQGKNRLESIELRDGRRLSCGIVLVAAGVYPNIELLKNSDLELGRGVRVDRYLRTRRPEVFAAGDIAEPETEPAYGLWPVAVEQGRIAGLNAIGAAISYRGQAPIASLKVVGIELTSIGIIEGVGADLIEITLEDEAEHCYRKLVIRGGRIIGAILLGFPEYTDLVKQAIHESWDISEYLEILRSGEWDALNQAPVAA